MKRRCLWIVCVCFIVSSIVPVAMGESYPARNVFFDKEPIYQVVSAEGILYGLVGNSLVQFGNNGSSTTLGNVETDGWVCALLAEQSDLYALVQGETAWHLLALSDHSTALTLNLPQGSWVRRARIYAGQLYLLCEAEGQTTLSSWRLADGSEAFSCTLQGVTDFDLLEDGRPLLLSRQQSMTGGKSTLAALDPASGTKSPWASWEAAFGGNMAYDPHRQTAYLFQRGEIYAVTPQGEPVLIDRVLSGDIISIALMDHGAALVVDDVLVIRNFDQSTTQALRVLCDHERGTDYRAFWEANPQVDLQFISPTLESCENQFVQDVLVANDQADVYVLDDLSLLFSLKEKGYFADIRQHARLSALTAQMYPAFRTLFCEGDAIAAFPKDAFLEVLCYHKPTFEGFGIEPPTTYSAYFDFCLDWLETLGDDHPEVQLTPFANDLTLKSLLMRHADEKMRQGETPVFSSPELVALIQQFFSVANANAESGREGSISLFASYTLPLLSEEDAYGYLPLSFGGEATWSPAEGDVSYFVVNPYGKNPQLAMDFIAAYNDQRTAVGQALLYQTINEPLENPLFQSEYSAMEQSLAALEARRLQAEATALHELEQAISAQRDRMDVFARSSRWAVTQGALDLYQSLCDRVWLNPGNPIPTLWDGLSQLDSSATQQDIDAFLNQLEQRWRMLRMENAWE